MEIINIILKHNKLHLNENGAQVNIRLCLLCIVDARCCLTAIENLEVLNEFQCASLQVLIVVSEDILCRSRQTIIVGEETVRLRFKGIKDTFVATLLAFEESDIGLKQVSVEVLVKIIQELTGEHSNIGMVLLGFGLKLNERYSEIVLRITQQVNVY